MTYGNMKKDKLVEVCKNIKEENIVKACQYIDKKGIPKNKNAKTAFIIYNEKEYPLKYTLEIANNEIINNSIKIGKNDCKPDTWCSLDTIQELIPNPQLFEIVSPYNENNYKLVEKYRKDLIDTFFQQGLNVKENNSHTVLKLNNNIAEVHPVQKKEAKFKVVINYDLLDEDKRNNITRVPDASNWTLNGVYYVTPQRSTYMEIVDKINNILKNLGKDNTNDKKEVNSNMEYDLKVLDAMVFSMYENDNTGEKQYDPSEISRLDRMNGYGTEGTHRQYLQINCMKCEEVEISGRGKDYFIHHGPKGSGKYSLSDKGIERAKEISSQFSLKLPNFTPLNQILYGPPGTGKTYNTVVEAMSIINNEKYENVSDEEYSKLKKDFDDLLGKRIEFVTFHQSYSYEEFVEGIKPYIPKQIWKYNDKNIEENKEDLPDVKYIGKQGVFREICKRADEEIPFDELYKLFMEKYPAGSTIRWENYEYVISYNDNESFTDNTKTNSSMPVYKLQQFYEENKKNRFSTPTELRKFAEKQDNPSSNGMEHSTFVVINLLENLLKPYILIIDEINRGNISKIFGELITLIEEDKRGKFKVRLPYSQDEFTVPENLYIIGTMNTSDRSIASVDIALRRRFTFKEMMPDPELVADFECSEKLGKSFKDMFKILNKKITILADRDHQIGHSYFIKDKHNGEGITGLQTIWFDSVLPLLNEYFYGDWEKLQEILGKAEDEDKKKDDGKYTSFIKKISLKGLNLNSSSYDEQNDCFDFVREDEINFEEALKNAFLKKKDDNKNNSPETGADTEQEK